MPSPLDARLFWSLLAARPDRGAGRDRAREEQGAGGQRRDRRRADLRLVRAHGRARRRGSRSRSAAPSCWRRRCWRWPRSPDRRLRDAGAQQAGRDRPHHRDRGARRMPARRGVHRRPPGARARGRHRGLGLPRLQAVAPRPGGEARGGRHLGGREAARRDLHRAAALADAGDRPLGRARAALAVAAGDPDRGPVARRLRGDARARRRARHGDHRPDGRARLLDRGHAHVRQAQPRGEGRDRRRARGGHLPRMGRELRARAGAVGADPPAAGAPAARPVRRDDARRRRERALAAAPLGSVGRAHRTASRCATRSAWWRPPSSGCCSPACCWR